MEGVGKENNAVREFWRRGRPWVETGCRKRRGLCVASQTGPMSLGTAGKAWPRTQQAGASLTGARRAPGQVGPFLNPKPSAVTS